MKKGLGLIFTLLIVLLLAACGSSEASSSGEKKTITFGATVGPYSNMVTKALKPLLEEKGYTVKNVEFSDYIQPNKALENGDLDANLFQHKIYYEAFEKEHDMDLSEIKIVPTAPMGVYSSKYDSLDNIEDGSTITIANDPTNLARTLIMLQDAELITIKDDIDPLRADVDDVVENPKNLKF